jgi:ABC-type glutathione transport system ATPase component
VHLPSGDTVVHGVDLDLHPGRVLALVGPSGAGKSLSVRALARLLPAGFRTAGQVWLGDDDLLGLSERQLRNVRGARLAWVGQDATASLNPTITVGRHLTETLHAHMRTWRRRHRADDHVRDQGTAALAAVGLPDPDRLWGAYPFELSGGQSQRVALALATVADPFVLLADEVTAELDVVSQAEVMDLLRGQADAGRAVLLVTHDLAAAARWADDVVVLDAGRVVEQGPVDAVLRAPTATLTRAWMAAATPAPAPATAPAEVPAGAPAAAPARAGSGS